MSIESLKQQARKHEQKEDWKKALDQYDKALAELAREEQVDIGLYNRVGDLHVRIGGLDDAVEHYEKAVDLYREAYLPNNAIAVCKKIIRNVPDHHRAYLQMGQIRAEQGFLPDARTQFLTYAERMQQAGHIDESFRALIEFCDLAPDDIGVRVTVAEQMAAKGLANEAIEQLAIAYRQYTQLGDGEEAEGIEAKILEIDPEADMAALSSITAYTPGAAPDDVEGLATFGEITLDDDAFGDSAEHDLGFGAPDTVQDAVEDNAGDDDEVEIDAGLGGFEIASGSSDDEGGEPEADALPTMNFGDDSDDGDADSLPTLDAGDDSDDGEADPLPTMDFGDDSEDGDAEPLPAMGAGDDSDAGDAEPLPTMDFGDDDGDAEPLPTMDFEDAPEDSAPLPTMDFDDVPEDSAPLPTMGFEDDAEPENVAGPAIPEIDFSSDDADTDVAAGVDDTLDEVSEALSDAVEEAGFDMPVVPAVIETPELPELVEAPQDAAAEPELAQPDAEPEESGDESANDGGGYVDLGAMILGGGEKKSTRFTVAYEEPSGDEEADFAKMLSQFKEKVSENLDTSDVRAHYDLGTAYKEMGLLDEAISSFQAALRASPDHLPTYELMGQTFMEMGQPEAAVRSLERAVEAGSTIEDELVGIYYYLGRAYEEVGGRESAVEYYDRVFALDINFADVTERLRELR